MSVLYMIAGIPGSGKSHWAEDNKEKLNTVIHSSDEIRAELGNINDQSQNDLVFNILHKRVKEDLLNGNNVIYDATNLSRKRRINFLSNELRDIPCEKICVLFATPYEVCCKNNAARDRKVPEHVITRMYKNFETPTIYEGFNDIQIVWWDYNKNELEYDISKSINEWRKISHDNPHHTLSIGDHMIAAKEHLLTMEYDDIMYYATLLHDCGKPFTKAFINSHGEPSETAHYYEHQKVGAYLSLFYLKELGYFTDDEILHVSLIINLHMQPFLAWDKSEKAKEKDRRLFGDNILSQVETLHKCDLEAH